MKPPFTSLHARLMLLMLVAALPAFAVIFYFAFWLHDRSEEHYQARIQGLAEQLAARHAAQIEETRLLLTTLAHIPDARAGKGPACTDLLAEIKAKSPPFLDNLLVAQPNGDILCSAVSADRVINVADLPWFRHGMAEPTFRVGEYHISRRTGAAVTTPTLPVVVDDRVVGLIAASLNLSWITAHATLDGLPTGVAYGIFDARGTYLLRLPDPPSRAGKNIGDTPLWRTVSGLGQAGVFRGLGPDGLPRLFAYAPLGPADRPYARLLVGVPEQLADAEALRLLWLALGGLLLAVLLGLAMGGLGARNLVLRPMRPIFDTVGRVAAGNLSARTGVTPSVNEISQLAGEVDAMAATLDERDQAVRRERDKAQTYLDLVGVMVVALDRQGEITLVNRKTCELLGCGEPCRCGNGNWFDRFVPEADRESTKRVFLDLMAGKGDLPEYYENLIQTRAGEHRLIAWRNAVLRNERGDIVGTLSAGEDITNMRRTQESLKDSQADLIRAQSIGHIGSWRLDVATEVLTWSEEAYRIFGIEPGGAVLSYETFLAAIHPDDRDYVDRMWQAALRGAAYDIEHRILAGGQLKWVRERAELQFGPDGALRAGFGTVQDITEPKRMQAEQERLQAQLQQAQKMEALGQLTGGIAHDFNNILASVLGFAKLSLRRHTPDPNGELAEYLREIIVAGERARDLVAKMLAFGRGQPGRPGQALAALPLAKEAVKMLAATIPSSIRVESRFDADLPDIAIDSTAFHQILVNLVINARDAVGDKGHITVSLRRRRVENLECLASRRLFSGDYVELAVTDDGTGIAPEILPRIFEPFYTTKDVGKGTGMGLAMVHGLVGRAGGHFQIESTPGAGTVFRIFLPLAEAHDTGPGVAPKPAEPVPLRPGHALVVDDEPAILHLLRAALADAGWRVSAYASPSQALAAFRADPEGYDALITDQTMPESTGIELTAAVHRLRPELPVILCTGHSDGLTDAVARQGGVDRFLYKPVDSETLLAALAESRLK